ncbi:ABC transporter permease [Dehalogenimonas etheniformans]|uniref:Transport permease protein n=1 Tax=Dehalogenimonas etheniformans TaxID=1536648 RepID=A0A2P5P6A9_9CHLR|nr:ABC transporter permease [Dehalogenimonas etheniformans]PPD57841.1 ABC transporter permease [Dehalogenimonas etheniformans]QNT75505.1 ABC transporter permease [Dehalogenimonas etheniformans]
MKDETTFQPEMIRTVLSIKERPPGLSPLATTLAFGWRAMLKIRHVPEQLFDVTASPIIFLLMFTYLFGGALAGSTGAYLQFVLPGILVMTIIMITIYTGLGINQDIKKGVFDRFRSLPIWRPSVIAGMLLADGARYTMASAVMILLGLALGYHPEAGFSGILLSVLLLLAFSSCLSWIWIALGLVMRTPESLMAVSMMILFPLTFVSNVFVAPQTMPGWLESFVNVNPVTHLVTAVRGLITGAPDAGEIAIVLAVSAALLLVFCPLAIRLYQKRQ